MKRTTIRTAKEPSKMFKRTTVRTAKKTQKCVGQPPFELLKIHMYEYLDMSRHDQMTQGSYGAESLSNHIVVHGEAAGDAHLCIDPLIFCKNHESLVFSGPTEIWHFVRTTFRRIKTNVPG